MPKTILAVDDSASIRQLVSFTLRSAGFEVIEAVDGEDALSRMKGSIHLVITDLNMPRMDGIELLKRIRSSPAYRFVPVIILTTESQTARKQEGKAAGATGWIVKPFSGEQVLAVLKRVVG
jgi:two-component system chemotaxis response regulator CheY